MATNAEVISRISNTLNTLTKDGRRSPRYILKTAQDKASFFISQKLGERTLFREGNLYTMLDCLEMVSIDVIKCDIIEFRMCNNIMRSKKKLPKLIYSKYGESIKEVTSVDGEFLFKPITPAQFRRNKDRKLKSKDLFFYVKDGYLYLPDSDVKRVSLQLITLDLYDKDECSECADKDCKSALEYEFICPDKLLEVVISETIKELSLSKQIPPSINPDLNEAT